MSLDPSHAEQQALSETLERENARLDGPERIDVALGAAVFAAGAALIAVARPIEHVAVLPILLSVAVLAVAQCVRIHTPLGFTVPTQLGFVPLLFAAPLALVAPLTLVATLLGMVPDVRRGRTTATRLVHMPGNCVFALGPVALLAAVGQSADHASTVVLLGALACQFLVDFAVYAARQRVGRGASLSSQLADSWIYGVDAALSPVALVVADRTRSDPAMVMSLLPLLGLLALFASERRKRLENTLELGNAYRGTALVLGDVIEADDRYTGAHSKSVVGLAVAVGEELGVDPDGQRNLEFGALLHDVGKVAIPKEIINKPGKLDPEEWMIIKTHTLVGQKMLDRVGGFMRDVGAIVRSHHERWDGGGYPDGIAGAAIPIEARIISVCDAWNAMRTDRAYRRALSAEGAVAELVAAAGSQFDPDAVAALLRVIRRDRSTYAKPEVNGAPLAAAIADPADSTSRERVESAASSGR